MFFDMWNNLQQVRYEWKPWYAKNKRAIRKPLNLWRPNWKRKARWIVLLAMPILPAVAFLTQIGVEPVYSNHYVEGANKSLQMTAMITLRLSGFAAVYALFHLIWYGLLFQMGRVYAHSRDIDARARRYGGDVIEKEDKEIRLIWLASVAGLIGLTAGVVFTALLLAPPDSMAAKTPEEVIVPLSLAVGVVLGIFILPTAVIRHIDILRTGIPVELVALAAQLQGTPGSHDLIATPFSRGAFLKLTPFTSIHDPS